VCPLVILGGFEMRRGVFAVPVLLLSVALVGAACSAPPAPKDWKIKPISVTVDDGEDNDGGDEPYIIQVGFRSKVGVPDSSSASISSQCYRGKLPANNAAPDGTTVQIPAGSADVAFPGVVNLDIADLAMDAAPFEVIGTLTFVMERDGIFGGCAVSDALRSALLGVLSDALDVLIANSPVPPTTEELIDLVVANLGDFVAAAGSLIGAVLEGLGNPDDVIGVAAQIHLPTKGALTDLVNGALDLAGLFSPGLENGFIPIDGLPSTLQIRVGTLSNSSAQFRFDVPGVADYRFRSDIGI
jgi:hypothetical protein